MDEHTEIEERVEQEDTRFSQIVSGALAVMFWILDAAINVILYLGQNKLAIKPTKRVSLSPQLKRDLFREQDRRCMYCGVRRILRNFEIDHIHPVARGGSNDSSNLQVLCGACNSRKGVHTDGEFRLRYKGLLRVAVEGRKPKPPKNPIPQKEFIRVTRETTAAAGVREYRANKYLTPKQRMVSGAPLAGAMVGVGWLFGWALIFPNLSIVGELALFGGVLIAVSIWAGLYLRAVYTGKLEE